MLSRVRRQRGVTLIELVVTLSVLALLMFMVVPDLTSTMNNARIRSAAESMSAGLQRARIEAMRSNEIVGFWVVTSNAAYGLDNGCALAANGTSWVVSRSDPSGACASEPSSTAEPRIKAKHAGGDTMASMAIAAKEVDKVTDATNISFDGFGRIALGTLRVIEFTSPQPDTRAIRIEMTASGVIRMCEPAIANTDSDPRRCLYS